MKYRFGMEYYDKTLQKLHIAKLQQELHQKMFANLCRTFLFEFFIIDWLPDRQCSQVLKGFGGSFEGNYV